MRAVSERYSPAVAWLVSAAMVWAYVFMIAAQVLAAAIFMQAFGGISIMYGVLASGVVLLIFTAIAGLRGVMWTDFAELLLMAIVAVFILFPQFFLDHRIREGLPNLPAEFYGKLGGANLVFLFGAIVFLGPANFMRLDIWQRVGSARTAGTAQGAFAWGIGGILLFASLFPLMGMATRSLGYTGDPQSAATEFVMQVYSSRILRGLCLAGVVAALMSTADSLLNMCGIAASQHIIDRKLWVGWWKTAPESEGRSELDRRLVRRLRVLTAIIGFLAIILAVWCGDIVKLIVDATTGFLVFAPVVLGVLLGWPGGKWRGLCSVGCGLAVLVICVLIGLSQEGFLPALVCSWGGYALGIYLDNKLGAKTRAGAEAQPASPVGK